MVLFMCLFGNCPNHNEVVVVYLILFYFSGWQEWIFNWCYEETNFLDHWSRIRLQFGEWCVLAYYPLLVCFTEWFFKAYDTWHPLCSSLLYVLQEISIVISLMGFKFSVFFLATLCCQWQSEQRKLLWQLHPCGCFLVFAEQWFHLMQQNPSAEKRKM